jgi:hypothetical protein
MGAAVPAHKWGFPRPDWVSRTSFVDSFSPDTLRISNVLLYHARDKNYENCNSAEIQLVALIVARMPLIR